MSAYGCVYLKNDLISCIAGCTRKLEKANKWREIARTHARTHARKNARMRSIKKVSLKRKYFPCNALSHKYGIY